MGFESPKMPSPEEMAKIEKERAISDAELLKGGAEYKFDKEGRKTLEPTSEQIEEARKEMEKDLKEKESIESKIEKLTDEEKKLLEIAKRSALAIEDIHILMYEGKIDKETRDKLSKEIEFLWIEAGKPLIEKLGRERFREIDRLKIEILERERPEYFKKKEEYEKGQEQEKSGLETNKESVKKLDNLYGEIYKDKEIAEIFETIINSKYHPVKRGDRYPKEFLQALLEEFSTPEKFEEYKNKSSKNIENMIKHYPSQKEELLERGKRWEGWLEKFKNFVYGKEAAVSEISKAENFDDLFKVIDLSGGIQGSQDFFEAEVLKDIINKIRQGEKTLTAVTRTAGLRDKVAELLESERERK